MKHLFDITLQVPKHLCIIEDSYYKITLDFFDELIDKVSNDYIITINFQGCLFISAPAALLLFSTINHIQLTHGFNRVKISTISKGSRLLYDPLISQSGIWDAINCKSIDDINRLIEKNNRFKTSCDPSIIKNVGAALGKIPNLNTEHIFFLTMAMKEAITNVVYHAYEKNDNNHNRWWQGAWVNTRDKIVNILIHDRGIGIIERYKKAEHTDQQALKEAMLQGFSSSGLSNRGMGTEDMKRPVNELHGYQRLTVYTGEYIYNYEFSSIDPKISKRESFVCGTLVHWQCSYGE